MDLVAYINFNIKGNGIAYNKYGSSILQNFSNIFRYIENISVSID